LNICYKYICQTKLLFLLVIVYLILVYLIFFRSVLLPQLTPSARASMAEFGLATMPKQSAIGSPLLILFVGFFSYNVVAIPYAFS